MHTNAIPQLLNKAILSGQLADKNFFFTNFHNTYKSLIYKLVSSRFKNRVDIEDVVSEIIERKFLRISLQRYLLSIDYLDAFIGRVTINYCNNIFARKKASRQRNEKYCQQHMSSTFSSPFSIRHFKLDFEKALSQLPPKQAIALTLAKEGFKAEEIKQKLNLSTPAAARMCVHRARKTIKYIYP